MKVEYFTDVENKLTVVSLASLDYQKHFDINVQTVLRIYNAFISESLIRLPTFELSDNYMQLWHNIIAHLQVKLLENSSNNIVNICRQYPYTITLQPFKIGLKYTTKSCTEIDLGIEYVYDTDADVNHMIEASEQSEISEYNSQVFRFTKLKLEIKIPVYRCTSQSNQFNCLARILKKELDIDISHLIQLESKVMVFDQ